MAAKQFENIRDWRWSDLTGRSADIHYSIGDPYAGPMDNPFLLDPAGPDGRGPLIAEKLAPASVSAASGDSSVKEK